MQWQQHHLGECLKLLSGGTPSKARNDFWGGDIPWVSCKDMKTERIRDAQDHLTPLGAKNGTRLVPADTILFVVRGMILAREFPVAMTKRPVAFNQDLKAAKPAPFIDNEFLFQWLRANTYEILGRVDEAGHGTTRIQTDRLLSLPISVPPLPVQQRIAGILSAYDELIENNQRRITILESMARALYREWFVHFRFPGHENHPRVASPLGEIPQGWEVKKVAEIISAHIGGGWGKDVPDEDHTEPAWVIRGTDIPEARYSHVAGIPHRVHTASNLRPRRLVAGDIVFEVSGGSKGQPVGRTLLITPQLLASLGGDVICASFCKRIQPDIDSYGSELLYLSFLEGYESGEIEQYQVQSTGISNFKWTEYIANTDRVVPRGAFRGQFRGHVAPLFTQVATLGRKIQNLRRTRDLLLPRLLSGQIEVEAIPDPDSLFANSESGREVST